MTTSLDLEARAVEALGRRLLFHAIGCVRTGGRTRPTPEDYPALNSDQWTEVVDKATEYAAALDCSEEEFRGAYEYLTGELP